jgi:hypothetical protein
MDATLPRLITQLQQERPPTPFESEIRALIKKMVATGEWNRRGLNTANDELQVISDRLAAIEAQLAAITAALGQAGRDVPE